MFQNVAQPDLIHSFVISGTEFLSHWVNPLHRAVVKNKTRLVKKLLKKKPDWAFQRDLFDHTPVDIALINKHTEMVDIFLNHKCVGATVVLTEAIQCASDEYFWALFSNWKHKLTQECLNRLLLGLIGKGNKTSVEKIVAEGAEINQECDPPIVTAAQCAAESSDVVRFLLSAGAHDVCASRGLSAIPACAQAGNFEVLQLLLEHGFKTWHGHPDSHPIEMFMPEASDTLPIQWYKTLICAGCPAITIDMQDTVNDECITFLQGAGFDTVGGEMNPAVAESTLNSLVVCCQKKIRKLALQTGTNIVFVVSKLTLPESMKEFLCLKM